MVIMGSNFYGQEKKIQFEFDTSYHQFYIADKNSTRTADSKDFWTDQALSDKLAIGENILGVSTASYGPIKGEITVLKNQPKKRDFSKYDHIVEAGIRVDSGILQIADSPNFHVEKEIELQPGSYRIRIYFSDLDIQDEDEGGDFYSIEIWRSEETEKTIIKMHPKSTAHNNG